MARYDKIDFFGGINQQADASRVRLDLGEYYLLMNGRTRRNVIRPIHLPLDITEGLPTGGILQGVYAINAIQVVFVSGQAFWKNFDPESSSWNKIPNFQLSATEDRIWMELVPASTVNFMRKAQDEEDKKSAIKLGTNVSGTPQCAVVMDGVNQPWAIFPDATARVTRSFAEWTPEFPEYVPIAKYPKRSGSKLYCVGTDLNGVFNQVLHSVSGAPLNFMVPVTSAGVKISNNERDSGAYAVADRPDFGELTAVQRINATQDAFFLSTVQNSHLMIPDYENKIFGEPTFQKRFLFNVGALNQECVVDLLGNTALIHYAGIRDFNAILNLQNEGRNSPLSQSINDLVAGITQTYGATISYDNFAVFALQTRYGPAIVWYDTLLQKFVAVDILNNVSAEIKQFASILTRTVRKLFFITADNHLYEYDASPQVATCRVYIKDFIPSSNTGEHTFSDLKAQFGVVRSSGHVEATVFADERRCATLARELTQGEVVDAASDSIPYSTAPREQGLPVDFFFEDAPQAWKTGAMLSWNADTDLLALSMATKEGEMAVSEQTKSGPYIAVDSELVLMVGNDGTVSEGRKALNRLMKQEPANLILGLGGHALPIADSLGMTVKFRPYWQGLRNTDKYYAVPGSAELSSDLGQPFYETLKQAPTRYFYLETEWVNFFLLNSGYDNMGTQVEIDNTDGALLPRSTQFSWLEKHLQRLGSGKFNIVLWSHPPYSSGTEFASLRDIPLKEWGVDALFSGHNGFYERLNVNGFPYYIAGTGSPDALIAVPETLREESYKILSQVGYMRLHIYPLSIAVEFVDSTGTVQDVSLINR